MISINFGPAAKQAGVILDPFTYSVEFLTLAASATQVGTFLTQGDSAFALGQTTYLIASNTNAAIAELQPFGSGLTTGLVPVLVTINEGGSGRNLSDRGIPIDSLFGTGSRPRLWNPVKLFDSNQTVNITAQNLSATAYNLRLAFHGFKIYGEPFQIDTFRDLVL